MDWYLPFKSKETRVQVPQTNRAKIYPLLTMLSKRPQAEAVQQSSTVVFERKIKISL